ncbi:HEPN domain-containing protein [Pyrobaculum calidifontis]|uniref:HEPN domain-containing protein n=1 Tax=Pyrobaculum calidifontis TaxID=181486 RepID=UPI0021F90DF9|nr:HEPN domain-containing protein [Pyrobaculum calidifontis]
MAKLLFLSAPWRVESWLRRAAKFREYAREDLRAGRYDSAAFFCATVGGACA